jgi:hypothetical protein
LDKINIFHPVFINYMFLLYIMNNRNKDSDDFEYKYMKYKAKYDSLLNNMVVQGGGGAKKKEHKTKKYKDYLDMSLRIDKALRKVLADNDK